MEPGNILKIKTLGEQWIDKDNIMLHACFQLLTDCIEKENLLSGHFDWAISGDLMSAKEEIQALYSWWKERIKGEPTEMVDLISTHHQYNKDTEMLIRLIRIRKFLWT